MIYLGSEIWEGEITYSYYSHKTNFIVHNGDEYDMYNQHGMWEYPQYEIKPLIKEHTIIYYNLTKTSRWEVTFYELLLPFLLKEL